jgi:hypothetical protein
VSYFTIPGSKSTKMSKCNELTGTVQIVHESISCLCPTGSNNLRDNDQNGARNVRYELISEVVLRAEIISPRAENADRRRLDPMIFRSKGRGSEGNEQ